MNFHVLSKLSNTLLLLYKKEINIKSVIILIINHYIYKTKIK